MFSILSPTDSVEIFKNEVSAVEGCFLNFFTTYIKNNFSAQICLFREISRLEDFWNIN